MSKVEGEEGWTAGEKERENHRLGGRSRGDKDFIIPDNPFHETIIIK